MNKSFKNLAALFGAGALTFSSSFGELPKFNNVTVTVVGDAGQNMESLNKYADDFTKAGGITERLGQDNQKKFWSEALSSYRAAGLLQ